MSDPERSPEDLFTIDEVARRLRMEKRTLRRLIDVGEFPRGQTASPGLLLWTADDIQYYRLRMAVRSRLRPKRDRGGRPKDSE